MSDPSNPFMATVFSAPPLIAACQALSSGQSANFPGMGTIVGATQDGMEWQTRLYHDTVNSVIHMMGKAANNDSSWSHQIYNILTNTWAQETANIVASGSSLSNPGHIYGNFAFDPTCGDIYQTKGGMDGSGADAHPKRLVWYQRSLPGWVYSPQSADISGSMASHANGLVYHPNLWGVGDGGWVLSTVNFTAFWRKADDSVIEVSTSPQSEFGNLYGDGVYWPANNCVIIGAGQNVGSNTGQLALIRPNAGGTPVITALGSHPFAEIGGDTRTFANLASLHVHPNNPNKLIAIGTSVNDYQTATLSGTTLTWTDQGAHPIYSGAGYPRNICSLGGGLNCLWAVGLNGSTPYSFLWYPPP